MLKVTECAAEHKTAPPVPDASLSLVYDQRQKSRQRLRLDNGDEIGLMLPHGTMLRHGDLLRAENGLIIEVRAAREPVSTVETGNAQQLARLCYHLGNRHVTIQIETSRVLYLRDPVLDDMVRQLGLVVSHELAPFQPEPGAYHRHAIDTPVDIQAGHH